MFRFCRLSLARGPITWKDVASSMKVLGLEPNASKDDIRKQYLSLAKKFHPDVTDGNDDKMSQINEAYEMVQENFHLMQQQGIGEQQDSGAVGGGAKGAKGGHIRTQPFHRSKNNINLSNEDEWFSKSEFDWSAAVGNVSDDDLKNEIYKPFTANKYFSFDDDANIYRMIRDGATVKQVARTLGHRPVAIERRLNNPQFKQRIQYVLRQQRIKKREPDAAQQTVFREPLLKKTQMTLEQRAAAADIGFDRGDIHKPDHGAWSAENVVSKLGKSYSHYARFNKGKQFSKQRR